MRKSVIASAIAISLTRVSLTRSIVYPFALTMIVRMATRMKRKMAVLPTRKRIEYLPALFLVAAIVFLPKGTESDSLSALAIVFVSIVLEAIPFMLVGALVGGLIESFVSRERLTAIMPGNGWLTVCIAAGAGFIFPVCECAVVPVVRRLIGKGLPLSAAIAYLLGGPVVNPIVAASTALAYAFDWRIVLLRLALGYGIAVAIGLIMGRIFRNSTAITEEAAEVHGDNALCGCGGSFIG
jgi:uncharacterized membrane protein YraQ (UPF0718 family)